MSEWISVGGQRIRRSRRLLAKGRVDYRRFFQLTPLPWHKLRAQPKSQTKNLFVCRSQREIIITNQPTVATKQKKQSPKKQPKGLKRSANNQRSSNQRRRLEPEAQMAIQDSSETEERSKTNSGVEPSSVEAAPGTSTESAEAELVLREIDPLRLAEECDQNIEASNSSSNALPPNNPTVRRRFPATPHYRRDSSDSDDLPEDQDEQNLFRDCIEVAPEDSNNRKSAYFMVRTTENLENNNSPPKPNFLETPRKSKRKANLQASPSQGFQYPWEKAELPIKINRCSTPLSCGHLCNFGTGSPQLNGPLSTPISLNRSDGDGPFLEYLAILASSGQTNPDQDRQHAGANNAQKTLSHIFDAIQAYKTQMNQLAIEPANNNPRLQEILRRFEPDVDKGTENDAHPYLSDDEDEAHQPVNKDRDVDTPEKDPTEEH
ncbi:hypothetical protein RB195_008554 [Necator americanus]|uniref:Uncharacterized protein n=1 Tax=Necator americanus TaxID=51031 RepID=A0ABR1CP70_NECAM